MYNTTVWEREERNIYMGCKEGPVQNCVLPMVTDGLYEKFVTSPVNLSKNCVFVENKTDFI